MQTIELIIKDENKDGVFAISLVESPAIEEDFVYLSSHEIELKVVDEEQRIVVGYALIPDKEIYRKVKDTEFNIIFSKETVRLTSELYMKQLNLNNVTVDHTKKIQGASVIESWITEDEKHDKVNLYGLKPILGGWAVKMKIYNDEEWQSVKDGKYKGFSIEGKFDGFEALEQSKQKNIYMSDLIKEVKEIIEVGLGKYDVELSDYVEVTGSYNALEKNYNIILKQIAMARTELKKAIELIQNQEELTNKFNNALTQFEKKAKDLGMDWKTATPEFTKYQQAVTRQYAPQHFKEVLTAYNNL